MHRNIMTVVKKLKNQEAQNLIFAYSKDIEGVIISFNLFFKSRGKMKNTEMFYHAGCFVCAVRRCGRLLEKMVRSKFNFSLNI